MYDGHLDPK
jgi:hypothetical protein